MSDPVLVPELVNLDVLFKDMQTEEYAKATAEQGNGIGLAQQLYEGVGNESLTEIPDKVVIDTFRKDIDPVSQKHYFPPEIVSRMASHTIIMFNHLKADAIRRVIQGDVEKTLQATKYLLLQKNLIRSMKKICVRLKKDVSVLPARNIPELISVIC